MGWSAKIVSYKGFWYQKLDDENFFSSYSLFITFDAGCNPFFIFCVIFQIFAVAKEHTE